MVGGKIDVYIDCVSPYSWFAFEYLEKHRKALKKHKVDIEYHPIFLGGINVATGNKPPWTVEAKAKYGVYDRKRACKYFGIPYTDPPPFFPILTIVPQRAMLFTKTIYNPKVYEVATRSLWESLWLNHNDISKPSVLKDTLTAALCSPTSSLSEDLRLSKDDIDGIIAATSSPELKKGLTQLTDEAVKLGAFGAPFFRVTADRGVSWRDGNYGNKVTEVEPFFGSDRFYHMFEFLAVPIEDMKILDKDQSGDKDKAKL